jgi:isocitrate lyase
LPAAVPACLLLLPAAGGRTSEGFFQIKGGIESAIARGLAYAPYADLVWFEVSAQR